MGNELVRNLKYILNCAIDLIYLSDEKCVICNEDLEEIEGLCSRCKQKINVSANSFNIEKNNFIIPCYSTSLYQGVIKELIIKLKYECNFKAGEILVQYMISIINKYKIEYDLITFVPSTDKVLRQREYNQSEYLAKILSEITRSKLAATLTKTKETKDQIGLDKAERWNNLEKSFKVKDYKKIENKKILLIDDVITTGATAFYCAEELLKSGAEKVTLLTAAKSKL